MLKHGRRPLQRGDAVARAHGVEVRMAARPRKPSCLKKVTGAGHGCDEPRLVAVLGVRAGQNPFVDAQGQ